MGPSSCSAACGRATACRLVLATVVSICGESDWGSARRFVGRFSEAYMFDAEFNFPRLNTRGVDVRVYAKYENSPQMDYYGPGQDSDKANRTSYRLEDASLDFKGRYRVWKGLWLGGYRRLYAPNTGPGQRSGFPSTEENLLRSRPPVSTLNRTFCEQALLCSTTTATWRPVRAKGGIII